MIFALVSCVSEDLPQTSIPQEGDKVTLTFGVQIPEAGVATRSMADPAITSLNLLVFDQNGYLVETATATVGGNTSWNDTTTPTDATKTQAFTVTLTKTSSYRAIHFVANADVSGLANFGHEDALIPSLVSIDTDDAYWQRMEFANGIASDSGTKLDNNTVVPLVRNFAKVTVTENLPNFVQGDTQIACFGPTTAAAIKEAGLRLDLEAPTAEAPSMTMALEQYLAKTNK